MTRYFFVVVITLSLSISACGVGREVSPTQIGGQFAVAPRFQPFYEAKGGVGYFGYALSEERLENGVYVQYFQRMRLVYRPNAPVGQQVTPSSFVPDDVLYELALRDPACLPPAQVRVGELYLNNCHTLRLDFQAAYMHFGGYEMLGYPVSEIYILEGQLAQNFETGIILWDPRRPEGTRFKLADAGQMFLDRTPVRYSRSATPTSAPVLTTTVKYPVLQAGQLQVITATVKRSDGRPLRAVAVKFTLKVEGGTVVMTTPPTNNQGVTVLELAPKELKTSTVINYEAEIIYEGISAIHRGRFSTWVTPPPPNPPRR